jgi:hypothetical protein
VDPINAGFRADPRDLIKYQESSGFASDHLLDGLIQKRLQPAGALSIQIMTRSQPKAGMQDRFLVLPAPVEVTLRPLICTII